MGSIRHAEQAAHGFSLAAGRDDANLFVIDLAQLFHFDDLLHGDIQVTELACHLRDVYHAAALEADHPPVRDRHIRDLLDAINVGSKRRYDDAALCNLEIMLEGLPDLPLGLRVPEKLRVRGVAHQRKDALRAVMGKAGNIDGFTVKRRIIHFEIACMDQRADRRNDRKRDRPRNGVAGLDEFHSKAAKLHFVPGCNATQIRVFDLCLIQLMLDERHRKPRAEHRRLKFLERIRNGADVVLMAMGDEDAADLLRVFFQIRHVRDHKVDAGHVVIRENQPAVHHDNILAVFDHGHIFADFTHAAKRDDLQLRF